MPCRGFDMYRNALWIWRSECLHSHMVSNLSPKVKAGGTAISPTTTAGFLVGDLWRPLLDSCCFFRWIFFVLSLPSSLCDTFARSAARALNSWNRIDLLLSSTHGRHFLATHRQVERQAETTERQEMSYPIPWLWYKNEMPKTNESQRSPFYIWPAALSINKIRLSQFHPKSMPNSCALEPGTVYRLPQAHRRMQWEIKKCLCCKYVRMDGWVHACLYERIWKQMNDCQKLPFSYC